MSTQIPLVSYRLIFLNPCSMYTQISFHIPPLFHIHPETQTCFISTQIPLTLFPCPTRFPSFMSTQIHLPFPMSTHPTCFISTQISLTLVFLSTQIPLVLYPPISLLPLFHVQIPPCFISTDIPLTLVPCPDPPLFYIHRYPSYPCSMSRSPLVLYSLISLLPLFHVHPDPPLFYIYPHPSNPCFISTDIPLTLVPCPNRPPLFHIHPYPSYPCSMSTQIPLGCSTLVVITRLSVHLSMSTASILCHEKAVPAISTKSVLVKYSFLCT